MGSDAIKQQTALLLWVMAGILTVNAALLMTVLIRRLGLNRATFAPRWSLVDLWFGLQGVLVGVFALVIPLGIVDLLLGVKLADMDNMTDPKTILYLLLPSAVLQNIAFFGVPAGFITLKYRLPLRAIGLPSLPRRREVMAGLLLGILGMAVSAGLEWGVGTIAAQHRDIAWVRAAINTDRSNPVAAMQKVLPHLGVTGLLWAVLGVGIAAPLGEEMLFRGFTFTIVKRRFGLAAGMIVSALLFTLPHSYGLGLVPVFALGLLFAWTYHNSGSLWIPILMHLTNNTVQVILAFLFPEAMK